MLFFSVGCCVRFFGCDFCLYIFVYCVFFCFKQKTAYEMPISDWNADVCSSDLHIQIHNSPYDGIEIFGGSTHLKYLVLTGNEDDNLDTDVGFRGTAQFVIAAQREGDNIGDTFLETDSNGSTTASNASEDALPRQ